jgi:hypothetical protein
MQKINFILSAFWMSCSIKIMVSSVYCKIETPHQLDEVEVHLLDHLPWLSQLERKAYAQWS